MRPSMLRGARACCAAAILAAAVGCVSLKPVVLDRKTQLENQILGAMKRLEDDLILASSVRGPAGRTLSPLEREAIEAMMVQEFNRDDVDQLKQDQLAGEGMNGQLVALATPEDPERARRLQQLVAEENRCRETLVRRVIQLGRDLTEKDRPFVERIFARLYRQTARPGSKVQRDGGTWETVPAAREKR